MRRTETIDQIRALRPGTTPADLAAVGGDRAALARHLALYHDLTLREADETIEDWLLLRAPGRGV